MAKDRTATAIKDTKVSSRLLIENGFVLDSTTNVDSYSIHLNFGNGAKLIIEKDYDYMAKLPDSWCVKLAQGGSEIYLHDVKYISEVTRLYYALTGESL